MKKDDNKKNDPKVNIDNDTNKKIIELEEALKRCQADFVNYKRRVNEERISNLKYEGSGVLMTLLPVFDNLTRAFNHIPDGIKDNDWVKGVIHIEQYFLKVLSDMNVQRIECLGMPADHNFHEVVDVKPGKKDIIIHILEDGYTFHDRVLRPAKVVVGDGS